MTSIAQINENEQREIRGSLKKFFAEYHLSGLLKMCRAEKQKGFSAFEIFRYLLCLVFCDRSMYMQIVTGRYEERFSKNAVYRFLSSARTNWERLICTLSERIINSSIRKLTSEDRQDAFIIDDTMFTRTGGKKTELCSKVFDHVTMKMKRGYRLLTFCSAKARVPSGYLWLDSACFSLRHKGFGGSSLSVAKEAKIL